MAVPVTSAAAPAPGGKTVGTTIGAGAAIAYAKDLTSVTVYYAGMEALPKEVLSSIESLLNGGYGLCLAMLGLYLGHLWNKANVRWGDGGTHQTMVNP